MLESAWRRIGHLEAFPQPELVRVRHPVVLMHGFGLFASFRRGGHLHSEAMNLRSHGVVAYAPNVSPFDTVRRRAGDWADRFEHILAETRADRLNVIAQSMGGLDARYLISQMGLHDVVASLVTVSTPHRGSSVANMILEKPDRLRRWTADVLNWIGTTSLDGATSDFLTAVRELTPDFVCNEFNPDTPDHPSVRYYSYAGRAGRGTGVPMGVFLRVLNRPLYEREGENDGFVSTSSARWGEFLGTIDADHAQEVGLEFPGSGTFDSNAFYCSVMERLAADGF